MKLSEAVKAFLNHSSIPNVDFRHGDFVQIVAGENAGVRGYLIAIVSLKPEITFVLTSETGLKIEVSQQHLAYLADASTVAALVERQTSGINTSRHGWQFRPCLVLPPRRVNFRAPNDGHWPLWLVLEEQDGGYAVGFDDSDSTFCLVTSCGTVIASYDTLMEAIDGM